MERLENEKDPARITLVSVPFHAPLSWSGKYGGCRVVRGEFFVRMSDGEVIK